MTILKENAMTYAALKTALEAMSPEQLAMPIVWAGDERGGYVKELWVAEEDWVGSDREDCLPRSEMAKCEPSISEDDMSMAIVIAKGTPQLVVD